MRGSGCAAETEMGGTMDPVTFTAGCGVATSAVRLGYVWLSAWSHRRRVELEIHRAELERATLMETISSLPPGSEVTEVLRDGRRVTIKLPPSKAA
ncbi:hypothetical protein AQJ43_35715 [Streptomyces avermitilis]|nr:hypothetical protein AQJ43_35715 [Streptomyces avermitilis]OOV24862.1 hypothetical protein SM007_29075 [Streptomyces avermitilis]BBJ47399.1 hypothetical protein SAVMC3_00280 [Streptomyces avermitilis]GDY69077.1 hypothetical protein SAV14893_084700 [Streptomyces avermitilis]GDY70543.1 hypothetical protein SAV31267_000280 [Streptomyces avermitilis]